MLLDVMQPEVDIRRTPRSAKDDNRDMVGLSFIVTPNDYDYGAVPYTFSKYGKNNALGQGRMPTSLGLKDAGLMTQTGLKDARTVGACSFSIIPQFHHSTIPISLRFEVRFSYTVKTSLHRSCAMKPTDGFSEEKV
jgi:hypothetical protein